MIDQELDLLAWTILQTKYGHSLLFRRQIFIFMLPAPLIPISFAYAIFRHGLFDVQKVLLRWVSSVRRVLRCTCLLYTSDAADE